MSKKASPSTGQSVVGLIGAGFVFALPILLFAILGNWLDGQFHTAPWLVLLGLLLGLISGIYGAYRLFKQVLSS